GQTFNLTPDTDNVEGTPHDDTINAFYLGDGESADQSTLTASDTIDGGAGWDELNIFVGDATEPGGGNAKVWGANSALPPSVTVKNVEVVNVRNGGEAQDGGPDVHNSLTNASRYEGLRELWQIDSANNVHHLG